jgi:hypothetical protein
MLDAEALGVGPLMRQREAFGIMFFVSPVAPGDPHRRESLTDLRETTLDGRASRGDVLSRGRRIDPRLRTAFVTHPSTLLAAAVRGWFDQLTRRLCVAGPMT